MSMAEIFRANAAKDRAAASAETLPNRREMFERAADRWDEMAATVEAHDQLTNKNAAAKAERQSALPDEP
jgi:hypothetical protein